jgi:predicted permease
MKIALQRGRFFTAQDDNHTPLIAVVDDVFARQYFSGQDPIGKRIVLNNGGRTLQIVGVVNHVKQWGLDLDDANSLRAQLYIPCMQMPDDFMGPSSDVVLRYQGSLAAVVDAVHATSRRMSNEQLIYGNQTMETILSDSMASRRFAMVLLGSFAILALGLAAIGIYGIVAYVVGQRTQEIGVRMALGAQRRDVLALVLWQGTRLAIVGAIIGIAGAVALIRLMANLLYGVSATDPIVFGGLAVLLILVAMGACYIPARRAMRINPVAALRCE